ncbi:gamma carbonic anhydrase family protein [Pseudarthrobacter sp. NPDC058196]|uniref:gamma carbonic anhydrase family protein n=1 Tax=Pseudarthrobacter sp. NPDC058196 TaxID=3346376 RepID=UPI0036DE5AC6
MGNNTTVGHVAICHGATIGDGVLVGMGAVVMNGATIGDESLIAAGAVILEGTVIPPRSLVAGVPAKVVRPVSDAEAASLVENAQNYAALAQQHQVNEFRVLKQPLTSKQEIGGPSLSGSSM